MLVRNIIIVASGLLTAFPSFAQHPARQKIDSLKKLLPGTERISRVDCLNALSEEYWWPPRVFPDSISCWAIPSYNEASKINYPFGLAISIMHLGVGEIYRKNFLTAEKYLRRSLQMFENLHSIKGLAWANLWLGQTMYSQNEFNQAHAFLEKSIPNLQMLDDWEGEGKAWAWMGFLYAAIGNYDSSFEYCRKSLLIRQKMSDHVCITAAFINMGQLYKVAGDYKDALDYYSQGLQYANAHAINTRTLYWSYLDEPMGIIYRLMNKTDSSIYYLEKAIQIDPENQMTRISLGETFIVKKQYDAALNFFLKPIEHFRKENDRWDLMRVLLDAAKAYQGKANDATALRYALEGFSIAKEAKVRQYMLDGYLLLSKLYKHLRKYDSAYSLMQSYTALNDSIMNERFLWRMTNYKNQAEYEKELEKVSVLDEDNKIKKNELKQASILKWVLIISLLIVALSGLIMYRNFELRRKNAKLRNTELQQQKTELEMQALRAQMNPHFIFNSLNSINRFIMQNDRAQASAYLTKFSRLVRMILQNSQASLITLESELESLQLYLEMEALRFNYHFGYKISVPENIDISALKVPPLFIQPYVENTIWHGLMHKEEKGQLDIEISQEGRFLFFKIRDNGIGRKQSAALASKSATRHKSMGLQITADRIAMMQRANGNVQPIIINDLVHADGSPAGTEIIIKIPVIYD
jgi:tetratricopeptide (TPR) repeat protein